MTMSDKPFLRKVYDVENPHEVRDYYDQWAGSYDAELTQNGYASPRRVAQALAELAPDLNAPLLDYGCGTGMSGEELRAAGFTIIDGADPSAEMLRQARPKQIYRSLVQLDLDQPAGPFVPASYPVAAAVGVIGPGAAPLSTLRVILDLLAPAGLLGVSFNDRALEDPAYPAALRQCHADGTAETVFAERGPHLPGLDVQSTVYVLRRS